MKRVFSLLLALALCLSCLPAVLAAPARDLTAETKLSTQLQTLGLFIGVGQNKDGSTDFALDRPLTRTEGIVMLMRALGYETASKGTPKNHPFRDVPQWADGYVSYAYTKGLTKGVSATQFGSSDLISAKMYLTFMLRALQYPEGEDGAFTWNKPEALASYCGILPRQVDTKHFLRADAVTVTAAALYAKRYQQDQTLQAYLSQQGAFTQEAFAAAFPTDPFADDRALEQAIVKAIHATTPLGMIDDNIYANECHRIVESYEKDGALHLTLLVGYQTAYLYKEQGGSATFALWELVLDAKTLAQRSLRTSAEIRDAGLELSDVFSAEALEIRQNTREDMWAVCTMEYREKLRTGAIAFKAPTYESDLAKVKKTLGEPIQTWETELCTILLGKVSDSEQLHVVYKQAASDEGTKPLRFEGLPGGKVSLSADKNWVYYSYAFDQSKRPPKDVYFFDFSIGSLPQSGTVLVSINLKEGTYGQQVMDSSIVLGDLNSTYERALITTTMGYYRNMRVLDNPLCSVQLTTSSGGPHGGYDHLSLIYKAGSPLGEGTEVELPLISTSYWGNTVAPKNLSLSPDGKSLHYSFTFDERLAFPIDDTTERVAYEAGTYDYSVDLATGKVAEKFTPKA